MLAQYLKQFVQLIFAPTKGWEDIERESGEQFRIAREDGISADSPRVRSASYVEEQNVWEEHRATRCFYSCFLPAICLFALSWLVRALYGTDDLLSCIQKAIVTFVTLFLSSQFARYIFMVYMPRIMAPSVLIEPKGRWFVLIMQCLTFLGTITLVSNIVKTHLALIEFLPFYVIFIIWKGAKFAGVDEKNVGLYMIIATLSVLGPTYLLSILLNALI